jgi:hypothetical protein
MHTLVPHNVVDEFNVDIRRVRSTDCDAMEPV